MKRASILIALLFWLPLSISGIALQSGYDLFQKALVLERADGKLQEAIALYQKLVDESGDKSLSAKAQLRIGMCYEKLGLREAQDAYQKVIDNYPQQQEEVSAAKQRIALLTKTLAVAADEPRFRKITIPANPGNGVLSPDGKMLAFASEGSIWVVPVSGNVDPDIAGAPVRLTEPMDARNSYNTLAWSGDGKWIAFQAGSQSVYVIPSNGGTAREVSGVRANVVTRLSLSPDGKMLGFHNDEGIYTISVDGGKAERLAEGSALEPALAPSFSPDGNSLAYKKSYLAEDGLPHNDIWVAGTGSGTIRKVIPRADAALGPVWSPDSRMIAYVQDQDICIVPAAAPGSGRIEPKRIRMPLVSGALYLAGWTSQGSLGIHLGRFPNLAIYTVPATGGRASLVSAAAWASHPRWSPDGKRIFFRGTGYILSVASDGSTEKTVLPYKRGLDEIFEATPGGGNNVSPDGERIVFSGARFVGKRGEKDYHIEVNIYTLAVDGGKPTQITSLPWNPDLPWGNQDRYPCWSPDGKSIAFIRDHKKEKDEFPAINIFIVPLDGGEPRQITSDSDKVSYGTIDWSPDGKHIAYFSSDKSINLASAEGGPGRMIVKVDDVHRHWELSWSPDGKEIAYACNGRIWRVPIQGGQPVEVKTGLDAEVSHLAWSRDGNTMAFTASKEIMDLYLMENFLPLVKNGR